MNDENKKLNYKLYSTIFIVFVLSVSTLQISIIYQQMELSYWLAILLFIYLLIVIAFVLLKLDNMFENHLSQIMIINTILYISLQIAFVFSFVFFKNIFIGILIFIFCFLSVVLIYIILGKLDILRKYSNIGVVSITFVIILIIAFSTMHINTLVLIKKNIESCNKHELSICLSSTATKKVKKYVDFDDENRMAFSINELVKSYTENDTFITFECEDYDKYTKKNKKKLPKKKKYNYDDFNIITKKKSINCLVSKSDDDEEIYLQFFILKDNIDPKTTILTNNTEITDIDFKSIDATENHVLIFRFKKNEVKDSFQVGDDELSYNKDGKFKVNYGLNFMTKLYDGGIGLNIAYEKSDILYKINILEINYEAFRLTFSLFFAAVGFIIIQQRNIKSIYRSTMKNIKKSNKKR